MFSKISKKIIDSFIDDGVVSTDDRELYQYGLQQGFNIVLNILTTLIIGFMFHMIWQAALFMLFYIPLRSYSGGYHAKTPQLCYLFSIIMIAIVLAIVKFFVFTSFTYYCLLFISSVIILILSPTEDLNKPLDEIEIKVYKKRALIILTIEVIVSAGLYLMNLKGIAICIVMSLYALSLMLILGRIKNYWIKKSQRQTF